MQRILVASGNAKKLAELSRLCDELPVEILSPADLMGDLPDVVEDADTFAGNAAKKALAFAQVAAEQLGKDVWALADDSGLCVDHLNGEPGVHSARFAELYQTPAEAIPPTVDPDSANNTLLLNRLDGIAESQRGAAFHCCICLAHNQEVLLTVNGSVRGKILAAPQGQDGFGYDPLFFHPSIGVTFAELSASGKAAVSHRGQAVGELRKALESLLGSPSQTP